LLVSKLKTQFGVDIPHQEMSFENVLKLYIENVDKMKQKIESNYKIIHSTKTQLNKFSIFKLLNITQSKLQSTQKSLSNFSLKMIGSKTKRSIDQQIKILKEHFQKISLDSLLNLFRINLNQVDLNHFNQPIFVVYSFLFNEYFKTRENLSSIVNNLYPQIEIPIDQTDINLSQIILNDFNTIQRECQSLSTKFVETVNQQSLLTLIPFLTQNYSDQK
jgi:hypothetical protein